MALTNIDVDLRDNIGRYLRVVIGEFDFDASYPTGGESLTPEDLGLSKIDFMLFPDAEGHALSYDITNEKVVAKYADYDAVADGALIEVPDTTDLSGLTDVKFIAFGR